VITTRRRSCALKTRVIRSRLTKASPMRDIFAGLWPAPAHRSLGCATPSGCENKVVNTQNSASERPNLLLEHRSKFAADMQKQSAKEKRIERPIRHPSAQSLQIGLQHSASPLAGSWRYCTSIHPPPRRSRCFIRRTANSRPGCASSSTGSSKSSHQSFRPWATAGPGGANSN